MAYYSEVVRISILATIAVIVYLYDNELLSRKRINALIAIGLLIIVNVSLERMGFLFNEKKDFIMLHGIIKAMEFSLAPIIPFLFAWVLAPNGFSNFKKLFIISGLITNAIFEFCSVVFPFTFYISSDNIYIRGTYYWIYVVTYVVGIVYLLFELILFTNRFQSRNVATLSYLLLFVIYGFTIRIRNYKLYTDWLVVTISYIIFVLIYNDITQKVDPLTFLLNRKAFETRKKRISYPTVVFIMDLNNFKLINDKFGHDAGDKALETISSIIKKVFSEIAYCFRIGGDEFCVILKPSKLKYLEGNVENHNIYLAISNLIESVHSLVEQQNTNDDLLKNCISVGYGIFDPKLRNDNSSPYYSATLDGAIKIADDMMYKEKEAYKASIKENKDN